MSARGWRAVGVALLVLACALCAGVRGAAAATAPVAPDCTGLSVSACYSAAKAAGFNEFAAEAVGSTCLTDTNCYGGDSTSQGVGSVAQTPYGCTGVGPDQFPCPGDAGTATSGGGYEFSFVYGVPDSALPESGACGGTRNYPSTSGACWSTDVFFAGSEPAGFVSDEAGSYGTDVGPATADEGVPKSTAPPPAPDTNTAAWAGVNADAFLQGLQLAGYLAVVLFFGLLGLHLLRRMFAAAGF